MPRGLIISHLQLESRIIILPVLFIIPLVPHSMLLSLSLFLSLISRFSRPLQNQTTNEIKLKSLVNEAWSSVVVSRQPCSTPFEGEKERERNRSAPVSYRIRSPRTIKMHFLCWLVARGWSREKVFNRKQLELHTRLIVRLITNCRSLRNTVLLRYLIFEKVTHTNLEKSYCIEKRVITCSLVTFLFFSFTLCVKCFQQLSIFV